MNGIIQQSLVHSWLKEVGSGINFFCAHHLPVCGMEFKSSVVVCVFKHCVYKPCHAFESGILVDVGRVGGYTEMLGEVIYEFNDHYRIATQREETVVTVYKILV